MQEVDEIYLILCTQNYSNWPHIYYYKVKQVMWYGQRIGYLSLVYTPASPPQTKLSILRPVIYSSPWDWSRGFPSDIFLCSRPKKSVISIRMDALRCTYFVRVKTSCVIRTKYDDFGFFTTSAIPAWACRSLFCSLKISRESFEFCFKNKFTPGVKTRIAGVEYTPQDATPAFVAFGNSKKHCNGYAFV